jgi:GTPase Era involved in 16S rRNA processing
MMRFHDQKKNLQTKLNVDLSMKKEMIIEDLNKKMKERVHELQQVYSERYISENETENINSQNTNT